MPVGIQNAAASANLLPMKKQKTPILHKENIGLLWAKVYSQKGLTTMKVGLYCICECCITASFLLCACGNEEFC